MKELVSLGLTRNEATTYTELLKQGEAKASKLVKQTGLHRVLVYDALDALIRKGLASSTIKENIKYFQSTNPENIVEFIEEKKQQAQSLIPKLQAMHNTATHQQVQVFEGIRGLKSAMNNMLKELSPNGHHSVFASGQMAIIMGPYYDRYQKIKHTNKIKTRVIYDEQFRSNKEIIKRTTGTIRFVQLSYFPTDTWIYKDKVLIVTYTAHPPIAILITSQHTATSYQKLFDGFWKDARK